MRSNLGRIAGNRSSKMAPWPILTYFRYALDNEKIILYIHFSK